MADQVDPSGASSPALNPSPPADMGQGAGQVAPSPPSAPSSPPSFIDKHLSQSQARFDAVAKEVHRITGIRKGLDALGRLGDAVTSDDVLDAGRPLAVHVATLASAYPHMWVPIVR